MNSSKSISIHNKMIETVTIKPEPTFEEEVEEILPDPLELPIQVKPDVLYEGEVKNKNSSFLPEKTLVNINGVLYLLEKIPDTMIQKNQTQKAVLHTGKSPLDDPAPCPHCGKLLKRRRNLKLHMQVCSNSLSYNCGLCPYQTSSETLLAHHVSACKKRTVSQALFDSKQDLFSKVCPRCNLSMPLETKVCDKCGSLNRWQCKNCNKHFENYSTVRHHYKTICKPVRFYHCQKCDYRSAFHKHILTHIRRSHPELKSSGTFKYIKKMKVPIGANGVEHLCSKCGKKFDEAEKLNRHRYLCKKSKSQELTEKIENSDNTSSSFSDSSPTDSSIELACFKQLIILHCKTCDNDTESEESCVAPQKSCSSCSSTLVYKCTRCNMLHENYDVIVNHAKTVCNQQKQIKCDQCNFLTDSNEKLIQHQRNLHGDISATCTNCGKYFTNSTLFVWHVASCGVSTRLECDRCPYTTFRKDYLQKHMSSFHGKSNAPNLNSITNSNFSKIQPCIQSFCVNCQRRQQTHDRVKFCKICRSELQFRCVTCNKMFSIDNPDACEHVKLHLEQLGLECQRCGRGFSEKSKYQLHVEWCGKIRSYSCELCSYSTKFVTHFQRHKQEVHRISSANANASPKEIRSRQSSKCIAGNDYFSDKIEPIKVDLKEEICLEMNKESSALLCQDSDALEAKNSSLISYKNDSENKLNLQCKVVLTRLNM